MQNMGKRAQSVASLLISCFHIAQFFGLIIGVRVIKTAVVDQADLPYTRDGVVPDLIFNCHGIPSRMTMGQMWEQCIGKLHCLVGNIGQFAIPFTPTEQLLSVVEEEPSGRRSELPLTGREQLYSGLCVMAINGVASKKKGRTPWHTIPGITGEPLDGLSYIGCVHYQRLRHMVCEKFHARALGPVNQMIRQPTEGRARQGGLRIGEMERNQCIFYTHRDLWGFGRP